MTAQATPEHLATVIPFPDAVRQRKRTPATSDIPPDITKRSNVIPIRRGKGREPVSGLGLPETPVSSPSGTDVTISQTLTDIGSLPPLSGSITDEVFKQAHFTGEEPGRKAR